MTFDTELLTRVQSFNSKASDNIAQAFFLSSACPDSHLSTHLAQIPGPTH